MADHHTTSLEYPPVQHNVYHDNENCPYGERIKEKHRQSGDAGKPLCDECKMLGLL